jgi:hypothetical protein
MQRCGPFFEGDGFGAGLVSSITSSPAAHPRMRIAIPPAMIATEVLVDHVYRHRSQVRERREISTMLLLNKWGGNFFRPSRLRRRSWG